MKDLAQFINEYCDEFTLKVHQAYPHYSWIDIVDDEIVGFISYFPLEDNDFDVVVSHNKDNKYTLTHWRVLRNTLKNRKKYLVINSDSSNEALIKGAKKYGGYFIGEDLHFPLQEEGEVNEPDTEEREG